MAMKDEDITRLVVHLEATTTKFFNATQRALAQSNKTAKGIEANFEKMSTKSTASFDKLGSSIQNSLARPMAAISGVLGTREIMRYADTWTEAGNRIAAAGDMVGLQGRSLEDIRKLADESRSAFDPTVQLYSRLLRSAGGVAQSELEIARATDIVNKAFKAGGAASSEMAAGILQLSQGLSSGVLQGDELRSVRENAPVLAKVIADYFGVTIGGLKDLGSEGKLTSESVFKAILSGQSQIDSAFSKTNRTIAEGFTAVQNALIEYIGLSDKSAGVTGMLNSALLALADNFENTANIALKLASIIAGALIGKSILGMTKSIGLGSVAVLDFIKSLRGLSTGAATAAVGVKALSAAAAPLAALFGAGLFLGFQAIASEAVRVNSALSDISATAASLGYATEDTVLQLDNTIEKVKELAEEERKLLAQRATQDKNTVLFGSPLANLAHQFTGGEAKTVMQAYDKFISAMVDGSHADRKAAELAANFAHGLLNGLELNLSDAHELIYSIFNMDGVSESLRSVLNEFFEVLKVVDQANYTAKIYVDTTEFDQALDSLSLGFENLIDMSKNLDLPPEMHQKLKELIEGFDGSIESVEELDIVINELAQTSPVFSQLASAINPFIDKVYQAYDAVKALNAESKQLQADVASRKVDTLRAGEDEANDPQGRLASMNAYVAEKQRINSLTAEQLALEKEIDSIRKDQPLLSDERARQLALENISANDRRKEEGKKSKDKDKNPISDLEKQILLMEKEAAMLASLNPLAAGYTNELAKWKKEQELLNEVEAAGIGLTPAIREKISILAQGYADTTEELEKLRQAHDNARQSMEDWFDLAKSSTRSFIDDLIQGKSAADALANALNQVGSYLINLGLNSLFGGGGGGFGLLGDFIGIGRREKGGPVTAGQPYIVGEKRAELFVPTQNGVILPKVPSSAGGSSGGGGFVFSPVIDARGASPEAVARLEDVVRRQNADFEIMVKKIIKDRDRGKW